MDELTLLRHYEPIVRLTRGELFLPMTVDAYLSHAALVRHTGAGWDVLADHGTLDRVELVRLAKEHPDEALSLRFVGESMDRAAYRSWRHRTDRQPFQRTSGAAATGLVARVIAALMRLSLLLRGRVPGGHTAVAYEQSRVDDDGATCHYYGHVVRDGGYVLLQYWFFYAMNDWRSTFSGVNDHEADWEQVTLAVPGDGSDLQREPAWVAFASHDERGADLRRRWDDPDLDRVGTHPIVYAGAGSHSAAYLPGDYLVTVSPALPRWVVRLRRRVARIIPWWDPESFGVGIPFIDYRRGDGVTIGAGQERAWEGHVIDDATDWVRDYRGLWGLDTGDPLGGERAPAGPRYERSGAVRQAWAAPLTWADLDGEPADQDEVERLWEARPAHLARSLREVGSELDVARLDLRAATVADRADGRPPRRPSKERARAQARVVELRRRQDELSSLGELASEERPPVATGIDPHAHLRHRSVPLGQDAAARSRAVRVWASASGAILFAVLGLLLIREGSSLIAPAVGLVLAMLLVEALVRRRLIAMVVNLSVLAVLVVVAIALVRLLVSNFRVGLGVLLLLFAAYMAVVTVTDAFLHRQPRQG